MIFNAIPFAVFLPIILSCIGRFLNENWYIKTSWF